MKKVIVFLMFLGLSTVSQATIYYVKAGGSGSGTSWLDASGDLQAMINAAYSSGGDTVWVAEGTYKPTYRIDNSFVEDPNPNNRHNTFSLKDGVVILGGFPNTGNPDSLNSRNWTIHPTILSGDLGTLNDSTDNAYHVVYANGVGTSTVLDGFVITDGQADNTQNILPTYTRSRGGGIVIINSSAQFINLIVRDNYVQQYGGGIAMCGIPNTLSPTFPVFFNVLICNNTVNPGSSGTGGGIFSDGISYPVFINVTVTENHIGGSEGSGYDNASKKNDTLSPRLINSIVWGNWAHGNKDGMNISSTTSNSDTIEYTKCIVFSDPNPNYQPPFGVLQIDPQFVRPDTGNFCLRHDSPAKDIGDITFGGYDTLPAIINNTDLAFNLRIYNFIPDLGAYEFQGTTIIPDSNGIVYVNKVQSGSDGSGSSWANAAMELADALRVAKSSNANTADSIQQIWVAQATYKPLYNAADGMTLSNGNRDNAFVMVENVQVYGGFPFDANDNDNAPNATLTMEQARNTRDWKAYPTILSGDIGLIDNSADNCYHVVISSGYVDTACLDGFIITKGNADSSTSITVNVAPIHKNNGGGIYCMTSSPLLRNISIDTNEAIAMGGGIYLHHSSMKLTNVIINKNKANDGGGMYNSTSNPTLTNVLLVKNRAENTGGGMYNKVAGPVLTNVTLSSNVAGDAGGINNVDMQSPYPPPEIRNSIIWGNTKTGGIASNVKNDATAFPVYLHSLVEGEPITFPGIIFNTDPLFVDTLNDDYHLSYCSPAINSGDNGCYTSNSPDLSNIVVDLDNHNRIFSSGMGDSIVDLGAYEFQQVQNLPSLLASVKDTTICYGDTIYISLTLTGSAPWRLVYAKDDGNGIIQDTLSISFNSHWWKLYPADTTTYKFLKLYDDKCSRILTDSIKIKVLSKPNLANTLTDETLCHGDTTTAIVFSGASDYQWLSSDSIAEIPWSTIQTGNFGRYAVENLTSSTLLTTVKIIPLYIDNGKTCIGDTSSFVITVFPKPVLTVTSGVLVNDTLCHNDSTKAIVFSGASNQEWWSSGSISDIPAGPLTGDFEKYLVKNSTSAVKETTVKIVPLYIDNGKTCSGDTSDFIITVLPNPTITNILPNDTICYGDTTKLIEFLSDVAGTVYQWTSDSLILDIPVGPLTGNFGKYAVKNETSYHRTTTISIVPQYTFNTYTCSGDTSRFSITAFPKPILTNTNIPTKDTLCHGTQTDSITFTGNANAYEWTSIPQINNIPTTDTGHFGKYTVINTTTSDITTTITVTPKYVYNGVACNGKDTNFSITVLSDPTATNIPPNDTLCHGEQTTFVTFTGMADSYEWESSLMIDSIPSGLQQTSIFGPYTVVNTSNAPLTTNIIVKCQKTFSNGKVCNGDSASFTITVNPLPVITNVFADTTLCDGEQTAEVIFAGIFSSYQWENTGDTVPGLPLGVQTDSTFSNYTVNNYTDSVITAIINIKVQYGAMCTLPDTNFKIHVNPTPKVDSLPSDTIILCGGTKTQSIKFSGIADLYEWEARGDYIGLPSGIQQGDFGEYLLENKGNTPLTALVDVRPSCTTGGKTCLGTTYTFAITVNPVPEVEYVPADYALCSGDSTTKVTFGTGNYEWTVSGDSIPGLPTGTRTEAFGEYTLENKTAAPLTAIITILPVYTAIGQNCSVKDTSFRITVNPEPYIDNNISDQILCSGEQTDEIIFTGVFTNYEWQIDENISGIPAGIQTIDFGEYTVENKTTVPIEGTVSINVYVTTNGLNCVKHDTLFHIIVNPEPTLTNTLSDETLCNGEKTTPITFTGNATRYEWTVSGSITELPNMQTGDFGSYTLTNNSSQPLSATITVTPIYSGAEIECSGTSQQFNITVIPNTKIDSITPNAFFFCEGEELRIKVSASGGNLNYQWYHNGTPLSGTMSEYYIVSKTSRSNSGIYYVEVSGFCGTAKSLSISIDVRDEKMLVEKWHDVILVDNSTNEFFGYQWYRDGVKIAGATEQFYQETGGLKGCYSVELTLAGGTKIFSCERCMDKTVSKSLSIYPNPIKQGSPIKVNPGQDNDKTNITRIEIYNTNTQLIMRKQVNANDIFEIETDNLSTGIYLLRIISDDGHIHNEKIVVY